MPEEFCEQCGQPLVPNARFCTACGWETGSQATLPLPQGVTGGYGNSGYQTQDYPQQGEPTPLEEFEQEFEREAAYEPAYDPYGQYDDGSAGGQGTGTGRGQNGKGKRKSKGTKSKTGKKSTGTGAAKNAAKGKASAGKADNKANSARKHPATTAAIVILVCIVVVFSGIGIVRMMTSDHGTASGTSSGSSATSSSAASGNTHAGNETAGQGNQDSKQSGKSSATDTKSKKTKAKQQDAQPSAGGVYANARFGYAVTIPAGFIWNPEATNGDGRTFTNNQTGMTITVWGSYNALNETPESAFEQTTAGHQVAYQQVTDTEFTASWEENGTITYVREMVSAGTIHAIRFDYPSAQRNDCDRIVEQVVPTLTVNDSASDAAGQ